MSTAEQVFIEGDTPQELSLESGLTSWNGQGARRRYRRHCLGWYFSRSCAFRRAKRWRDVTDALGLPSPT